MTAENSETIPWCARRVESTFGLYKQIRNDYVSLGYQNIEAITIARMNRTADWYAAQSYEDQRDAVQVSAEDKRRMRARRAQERAEWDKLNAETLFRNLESVIACDK